MAEQPRRLPPLPVLAALSILVVGYAAAIALGPWTRAIHVVAGLIALAIAATLIYGLWRGNSLARGVIVLLMAGNLISGFLSHASNSGWRPVTMAAALVVAALLLVPQRSRRWFAGPSWDSAQNPGPLQEQPVDTEALWEETEAGERR